MMRTLIDELYDLNRRMNSFYDSNGYSRAVSFGRTNLYESADDYVVVSRLPGVSKDSVTITLKDNALHLSGERKSEDKENVSKHLSERYKGKFERSFMLNEKIDPEKVSAEMKNGLLIVKLQKSAETKPRKIEIK